MSWISPPPYTLISWLCLVLLSSCADPGSQALRKQRAQLLSRDLQRLSPSVSRKEADRMAVTAIEKSAELSEVYQPVSIPWFNNWLVNRGLRQRGLCYQWRNDLFPHLYSLKSKTLGLHLAASRRGTALEHNSIVVTACGQPFEQGIILDAWRRGGRLWWGRFEDDKRHPWKKLTRDQTPMSLRPLLMPQHYPRASSR